MASTGFRFTFSDNLMEKYRASIFAPLLPTDLTFTMDLQGPILPDYEE